MMFVSDFIGDEVRSRNLLPDCVSQREISPIEPIVARTRPSLLKSESTGELSGTIVCNSFPDLTSQIFTALLCIGAVEDIAVSGFGPYVTGVPTNPLNGSSGFNTRAAATGGTGWIYEPETGKVTAVLPAVLAPIAGEVSGYAELLERGGAVSDSPRAEARE